MKNERLKQFVEKYKQYYFTIAPDEKRIEKEILGVLINHPTSHEKENEICGMLKKGDQEL